MDLNLSTGNTETLTKVLKRSDNPHFLITNGPGIDTLILQILDPNPKLPENYERGLVGPIKVQQRKERYAGVWLPKKRNDGLITTNCYLTISSVGRLCDDRWSDKTILFNNGDIDDFKEFRGFYNFHTRKGVMVETM